MKKSNVKVLLGSMLILALLSCEKNTTEECTLKFCLDTLSSDETELLYYPVIDAHMQIYNYDSYWGASYMVQNGVKAANNESDHYNKVLNEMDTNNVVLSMAHSRATTCAEYYNNHPEVNSRFIFGISLADYSKMNGGWTLFDTPEDIETLIIENKIRAIGEFLGVYWNIPYHGSTYQVLFQLAEKYSLTACVHTGIVPFYANLHL